MIVIDLVGDIEIDPPRRKKTNGLRLIQTAGTIQGNFGSDVWWIPMTKQIGIKIMHSCRYPKDKRASFRTEYYAKAQESALWLKWNWQECKRLLSGNWSYLPEVYGHCIVRHSGNYEFGMTRSRKSGHDKNIYYPAWFMAVYEKAGDITEEELVEYCSAFDQDSMRHIQLGVKHLGGFARHPDGRLIRVDLDNELGGKCA